MSEAGFVCIGQVAESFSGYPFESKEFCPPGEGEARVFRGDNLKEGHSEWGAKEKRWKAITPELEKYQLKQNDVLVGMDGSKVGKNWTRVGKGDLPALLGQRVCRIRAGEFADQDFIFHIFGSYDFKSYVECVKTGTSIPHISNNQIRDFGVFLPPLPEQKKIAEILSGIDESIHIHQQKIEDLSTLLRELLREHYQERCENSDLHLEKVIRLPIQYGANASATKLQSGEPRYIRITDIKEDGALNQLNAVGIDLPANDWNNYLLREGDLLLARTGNTIGKSYLHKRTNEELVFAGYLLRVALDQEAYRPEYLFLFTQSDIYKNWISETSRTGAQPNINAKEYGAMPIPYSSISEQDAFIGRAMSLRRSKSILSNKVDKLKMLKQAISADLLSGRKRVSI